MKALHIIFIFLIAGICSCRTQIKYVPVESVKTDTLYSYKKQVDSILQKDSIYIIVKGDTVTEYRYKYLYRYRDRIDTLYLSHTDSIPVPYPVEKQLGKWDQLKVDFGGWAIGVLFIFILIVFGQIIYKMKK